MGETYLAYTLNDKGSITIGDEPLGVGGEGKVYSVTGFLPGFDTSKLVAKIYYEPESRAAKVLTMLKNPVKTSSVAWPQAVLLKDGKFVGYLMLKLDSKNYRILAEFNNSKQRRETSPEYNLKYAYVSLLNLAQTIMKVNNSGHYLGDINESNIFIASNANVLIVDTDSAEVHGDGKVFPCTVGKPEYTAPELSTGWLKEHKRTPSSEVFAYSVIAWQLLTGGTHPTDAIPLDDDAAEYSVTDKIKERIYPSLYPLEGFKRLPRVPTNAIPKSLLKLFKQTFLSDPTQRPSFNDYILTLKNIISELVECEVNNNHYYVRSEGDCKWCEQKRNSFDPWDNDTYKTLDKQVSLDPLSFSNGKISTPTRVPMQQQATPANPSSNTNTVPQNSQSFSNMGVGSSVSTGSSTPIVIPEKIKGRMTVIYADGTYGPRPGLSVLLHNNKKLFIEAIKTETPKFLRFWWQKTEPLINLKFAPIALVLSSLLALVWLFLPKFENILPSVSFVDWGFVLDWLTRLSVGSSLFFVVFLFLSSVFDYLRHRKRFGGVSGYVVAGFWYLLLRHVLISLFYGVVFILLIGFLLLIGIVKIISLGIMENNSNK